MHIFSPSLFKCTRVSLSGFEIEKQNLMQLTYNSIPTALEEVFLNVPKRAPLKNSEVENNMATLNIGIRKVIDNKSL